MITIREYQGMRKRSYVSKNVHVGYIGKNKNEELRRQQGAMEGRVREDSEGEEDVPFHLEYWEKSESKRFLLPFICSSL